MALFTIKYIPQNSAQVFGQDQAVSALKDYITHYKQKPHRAALLLGPIGNGKTSSVYALAKELQYDLLEINSSDLRNEASMKSFLGSAIGQQSLFFRPKIILVDEVDNISGVQDRGCIPALITVMEKSTFPLILTANDVSDSKFKNLLKNVQVIDFHPLQYKTIAHALHWVAEQEGITVEEKAINSLARQADGDLRAALLDFQSCSFDKQFTFDRLASLSDRKRTETILNALTIIFKSSSVDTALVALDNVNMDPTDVMFWIDENLPKEYGTASSLAKAYEHLARADVFQGRIRRQQHWRLLVYINSLLTAGVSSAKDAKNSSFVPYQRTMRFLRMWQAKMKWGKKKEIAKKLGAATHTSAKVAYEQVPYLEIIFKRSDLPASQKIAQELKLEDEEMEWMKR